MKEIWNVSLKDVEASNELEDFGDLQAHYFEPGGVFLGALVGDHIIGTGGIVPRDGQTCELKRLWLLKEHRGLGISRDITARLIRHAREHGYSRIVMEIYSPEKQVAAVRLCASLGFEPMPLYEPDSKCGLAMSLDLEPKLN